MKIVGILRISKVHKVCEDCEDYCYQEDHEDCGDHLNY